MANIGGTTNTNSRSNISVTSINCEGGGGGGTLTTASPLTCANTTNQSTSVITNGPAQPPLLNGNHFYGNGGIRISVPKMEESDEESETELSNIEHTAIVNMRKNRTTISTVPRPMSWEGELSETEDGMDTENTTATREDSSNGATYSMAHNTSNLSSGINTAHLTGQQFNQMPLLAKESIKPEYETLSDAMSNPMSLFSSNKKLPPDLINLKFEPGIHENNTTSSSSSNALNSPLLARSKTTNLLPANPSPDSAIHSVYTHSSPSQSPLTSRHAPYTPSLSRNNSDASHSSCYSYSSEFSPTHSPIQGRHHMYNTFNGSPLHHSVLYRPMLDGSNSAATNNSGGSGSGSVALDSTQRTHVQQEDSILEGEALPSAGISRQQLINR